MTRGQKIALGSTLAAAGVGGAVYFGYQYLHGKQIGNAVTNLSATIAPAVLQPSGPQQVTVTVNWQNASNRKWTYGVQGAVLEQATTNGGIVAGHLFNSQSTASQAEGAFIAGDISAVQQMIASPADRVVFTTANPNSTASATLYGYIDPSEIVGPIEIVVWIEPGARAGELVTQDPVGTPVPHPAGSATLVASEGVA